MSNNGRRPKPGESYTVRCSNCGKEQKNPNRIKIGNCSLCGETHLTDFAAGVRDGYKDATGIDPIKSGKVDTDAVMRRALHHAETQAPTVTPEPQQVGPADGTDHGDVMIEGMHLLLWRVVPASIFVLGYGGMMIGPVEGEPTPLIAILGLSAALLGTVGVFIILISLCYTLGDAHRRYQERGGDE